MELIVVERLQEETNCRQRITHVRTIKNQVANLWGHDSENTR
jgi:hypothetical protein